jgi:hypothetical protein
MKKLHIESLDELEAMFREKTVEMTDAIKESIQEAYDAKKRTALLFEIQIEGVESAFEISITKKEWIIALENCLKHYEEWEHSDDAIDTFLLIKTLKDEQAS